MKDGVRLSQADMTRADWEMLAEFPTRVEGRRNGVRVGPEVVRLFPRLE
jgi:hypothetical protein